MTEHGARCGQKDAADARLAICYYLNLSVFNLVWQKIAIVTRSHKSANLVRISRLRIGTIEINLSTNLHYFYIK